MKRLWQFLWFGCFHVWKEDQRTHLVRTSREEIPYGLAVYCTCAKCGLPKRFDLA
jgi:hypothetical protein